MKNPFANEVTNSKRKLLANLGIYSIAYDYANHKKNIGERVALYKRTHKQYLRNHKLGKFAKVNK